MATRAELGLQRGDLVMWVSAIRKLPWGVEGGLPLYAPDVTVIVEYGRVIAVEDRSTSIQVLCTNSPYYYEKPGSVVHVGALFPKYVSEDDLKLRREMERACLTITKCIDAKGNVTVELKRKQ